MYVHYSKYMYTYAYVANGHSHSLAEDGNERCVSQQELAEVRRELNQLQGQLTYWQNTTLTLIKDHVTTGEVDMQVHVHVLCEYRTGEARRVGGPGRVGRGEIRQ